MSNRFAVFDIDGTLMRWQMLHAIFDRLGESGQLLPGDYELFKTARKEWKARLNIEGFRDYELKLVEVVERNLEHILPGDLQVAADEVFAKQKDQTYRYTRDLIRDLKAQGYTILAISGSPAEICQHIAKYFAFDDFAATIHYQKAGRYTGEIMVAPHHKPELLQGLVAKHSLTFEGSIGVGDSEGDIGMLSLVENPIAFNPTRGLYEHAAAQGWKIAVERKNMIYELENGGDGYRLVHTNV